MAHQLTLNSTSLDELKAKVAALPEEKKVQESKAVTPTKSAQSVTPDSGYDGIAQVDVGAIPDEYADVSRVTAERLRTAYGDVFVDANGEEQTGMLDVSEIRVHNSGHMFAFALPIDSIYDIGTEYRSFVRVFPSEDIFGTVSDSQVLDGKTFTNYAGRALTGTMPNNGAAALSINPLSSESVTIPKGYHNGSGKASISGELLTELNEINGAATAATTVAAGVECVATNVNTQAGLISQIRTALEGKMGGSGAKTSTLVFISPDNNLGLTYGATVLNETGDISSIVGSLDLSIENSYTNTVENVICNSIFAFSYHAFGLGIQPSLSLSDIFFPYNMDMFDGDAYSFQITIPSEPGTYVIEMI